MVHAEGQPAQLPVKEVFIFGQVLVRPIANGGFRLLHRSDAECTEGLKHSSNPEDALELSRFDNGGRYRPLKTAPNLRRGWVLELTNAEQLCRALDYFYPGRLGALAARQAGRLSVTPLRQTLDRQTGMYRIAAKISDAELNDVVANFCRSDGGCLRTILWKRDAEGRVPSTKLPLDKFDAAYDQALATNGSVENAVHVPLLCQEACNLLVAACRKAVKAR